ncbi:MAG: gephyrin-like molybdotransferase Glp [Pseudomonadota bacterium]
MKPFFQVQTVAQVHAHIQQVAPLPGQEVDLLEAGGRTLARDLVAPHDLPGFERSCMDGYAVQAADTFGVSEALPGYLTLAGEVMMGQVPGFTLAPGQCARIMTGGMLPAGADAVVMVEHTRGLDPQTVEVSRAVAPGSHLLGPQDDARAGQVLLPAGQVLRPQDLGLLAALGCARVPVARRPLVGIISTGDEVVPVQATPGPGQVRDVNTHTLARAVSEAGGQPRILGLVGDDETLLAQAVAQSLAHNDLTLLSGGSSMGSRDLTAQIFLAQAGAEMLVHGVAVAPGKPFIWVRAARGHLLGLPGQVASCLVAFHLFAEPMIERLLGRPGRAFSRFGRQGAVLARNLASAPGREEYVRVRLVSQNGHVAAEPIFGKSGLIRTLVEGDGLLRVPLNREGLEAGESVEVLTFPAPLPA